MSILLSRPKKISELLLPKEHHMGWQKIIINGLLVGACILFMKRMDMHSSLHAASHQNLPEVLSAMVPKGWEIMDGVKKFTPDNLYLQINGRAEFFLSYDMLSMTFASYIHKSDETQFMDISVYDMGKPSHAFGVFSSERTRADESLRLGRAGYRSGSNYFIWKGRYYIRIMASYNTEPMRRLGMKLAHKLTSTLIDTGESIWGLRAMPLEDLIPDSVQYALRDAMGLDFMTHTYTANYRLGSEVVTAFLSRKKDMGSAEKILSKYAAYGKQFGRGSERLTVDGLNLVLCDMDGTFDVIFRKDRLIAGVTAVENRERAIDFAKKFFRKLNSS